MAITLFRHGITEANKRQEYLGWGDSPLCMESSSKVSLKAAYDLYFSSDLNRCVETLLDYLPHAKPILLHELREMNFGMFEGKTYEQLKGQRAYQDWIEKPFAVTPPDGEDFNSFSYRVDSAWEKIINEMKRLNVRKSFIMTHGGVIRLILTKYAPVEKDFWDWPIPHNLGYELVFEKDSLRSGKRCTSLREVPLMANERG